jgi:hypothetical protein
MNPWRESITRRLNDLCHLRLGWDGYGGLPVSLASAGHAMEIIDTIYFEGLPSPCAVPGSSGNVQLEWHLEWKGRQIEMEIHILNGYLVNFWGCCDAAVDHSIELSLNRNNLGEIKRQIQSLLEKETR